MSIVIEIRTANHRTVANSVTEQIYRLQITDLLKQTWNYITISFINEKKITIYLNYAWNQISSHIKTDRHTETDRMTER